MPRKMQTFLVFAAVILAGCGGGSAGGGRRLSDVVAADAKEGREASRDSRAGGGDSRTRARSDHRDGGGDHRDGAYGSDDYSESDSGGSGGVLGWLFQAIFRGGEDEEDATTHHGYTEFGETEAGAHDPFVGREVGGEAPGSGEGPPLALGRFALGYRQGWSHWAGDAIEGFETGMITAGFGPRDGFKLYLGFYYGHGDFGRANVASSLDDLAEKGLELGIRTYLTPDHTLLGTYFLVGGRIGGLDWKYRDPVVSTTEGGGVTRIRDDRVLDGGPFAGAGLSILQTRRVHLGFGVMTGVRFTKGTTDRGLVNDVFKDVGFVQWNLEGSFRF